MVMVVSLGGSFMFAYPDKVLELKRILNKFKEKFIIVCGGGRLAREYIAFGKKLGLKQVTLHEAGIKSTQLNAWIIAKKFGGTFSDGDPREIKPSAKIMVMGGYKPGWTTDTCSAYAAISSKSKIIFNLSKENKIYNKDPSKSRDARPIDKMNFNRLYELTIGKRVPGMNFIFDPLAGKLCKRNGIDVVVTNDVTDILRYIMRLPIKGTLITETR